MYERPDYMTEQGAHYLMRQLKAFWKARNKHPRVWVEGVRISASKEAPDGVYYVVRSDIATSAL